MTVTCQLCEEYDGVFFCSGCNEHTCDKCWNKVRAHRNNQLGPDGIPHERVSPDIHEQVIQCTAEPVDELDQERQHQGDEDTKWFGLDRDAGGDPILAEYRRYAAIMMESSQCAEGPRFPNLVSFIGQTGTLSSMS
jgi:hypothetical protein